MKKASESILASRILKAIACAAIAMILLVCLAGMGMPVQADGPDARDAGAPAEILISDLSAIPDGYDAVGASMAYIIAIPGT